MRDRLLRLGVDTVDILCSAMFPFDRSWVGKLKEIKVKLLMTKPAEVARALGITDGFAAEPPPAPAVAETPPAPAPDSDEQEDMGTLLQKMHWKRFTELCAEVFATDGFPFRGMNRKPLVRILMSRSEEVARVLEATKKAAARADAQKAMRNAEINKLKYICQHLELDFSTCVRKNDVIDLLLGGAVDPVYITEALRLINASGDGWETARPSLPPPRAGPGASGARGESGPPPSPAAADHHHHHHHPPPPPPPPTPPHAAEASPSEVHMNTFILDFSCHLISPLTAYPPHPRPAPQHPAMPRLALHRFAPPHLALAIQY